jgi:hypothetical protein
MHRAARFEPANLGSNSMHAKHYTTEVTCGVLGLADLHCVSFSELPYIGLRRYPSDQVVKMPRCTNFRAVNVGSVDG